MRVTVKVPCLVLAVVLAGCSVFDPDLLPPQKEPEGDAGPGPSTCGRRWPAAPSGTETGDVGLLVFAMRGIVLDQRGPGRSWSEIGYDLDCYNTQTSRDAVTEGQECVPRNALPPPEGGYTEGNPPSPLSTDGVEGIDNVFGDKFYPLVDTTVDTTQGVDFEEEANAAQALGHGTLLIGVEGWNGQEDDRRLTAWIAQAAAGTPCTEVPLVQFNAQNELVYIAGGQPAPPPAWDGNDCWWIRHDAFAAGSSPPTLSIVDDLAYIAGRTAVVRLPDRQPIQFFAGPVGARVLLTSAVTTATVEGDLSDLSTVRLANNVVAGRWSTVDLSQSATYAGICGLAQNLLTSQLDGMADLRSNPAVDHALDQPCDAISLGVRFEEGVPGRLAHGDDPADSMAIGTPLVDHCAM
jgi:hypothetical protein